MKLYHFTSRAAAQEILQRGFREGAEGGIWLSPAPATTSGEDARSALLEVTLNVSEEELTSYRREVEEEVWDEEVGDFVPDHGWPKYNWFEIPAAILNAKSVLREVEGEERRKLVE